MSQSMISCWFQPPGIPKSIPLSDQTMVDLIPKIRAYTQSTWCRNFDYLQVRSRPLTDNKLIKEHPSATSNLYWGLFWSRAFSSSVVGEAFQASFRYTTLLRKMHYVKKAWIHPLLINKRTSRVHQDSVSVGVGSWIVVQYLSSCKTTLNRRYDFWGFKPLGCI